MFGEVTEVRLSDRGDSIHAAFERAAEHVHRKGGFDSSMLSDGQIRALHEAIYRCLSGAVREGVTEERGDLAGRLRADAFFYSGFKTFHEMKESAFLLTDEAGNLRPLREFQQAVAKIDSTYNKRWLETEYNQAVQSAAMAERWQQFEEGAERYDLQYRAVADERTRADHRALNGVTLPFSDPFWENYYPPNGWNCRCTVVQVRKGKYERSVSSEAIDKGEAATSKPKQELFRTNTAKKKRLFPEHNAYTTSSCKGCSQLGEFTLAYNPGSELCRACKVIVSCAENRKINQKKEFKKLEKAIKDRVPKGIIEASVLQTGRIAISNSILEGYFAHTRSQEERELIECVLNNPQKLKPLELNVELGKGKNLEKEKDRKNIERKQRRGVIHYNWYEFPLDNEVYEIGFENIEGYQEVPYCVRKQKK